VSSYERIEALASDLARLRALEPLFANALADAVDDSDDDDGISHVRQRHLSIDTPHVEDLRAIVRAVVRHRIWLARQFGVQSMVVLYRGSLLRSKLRAAICDFHARNDVAPVAPVPLPCALRATQLERFLRQELLKARQRRTSWRLAHPNEPAESPRWFGFECLEEGLDGFTAAFAARSAAMTPRARRALSLEFCRVACDTYQRAWNRLWHRGGFHGPDCDAA